MKTVADRIVELFTELGLSRRAFSKEVGIDDRTIKNYIDNNYPPTRLSINKILSAFPIVNPQWLKEGKGEMYLQEERIVYEYKQKGCPYYNVDFTCGFVDVENDTTTNPDGYINTPYNTSSTVWCNATGQSMYPVIQSGDLIALEPLMDINSILYGEIYAVVTEDFRTIKRIFHSEKPNCLRLVPDNHTGYEPIDVHLSKIYHIYRVKANIHKF